MLLRGKESFSTSFCPSEITLHYPFTQKLSTVYHLLFDTMDFYSEIEALHEGQFHTNVLRQKNTKNPKETTKLLRGVYNTEYY